MKRFLPLLLIVPLAACQGDAPPRFELVAARAVQTTDRGMLIELDLTGENPSDREIRLREARYSVQIDGANVFRSARSPEVALGPYGRVTMTLPVAIQQAEWTGVSPVVGIRGQMLYLDPGPLAEVLYDARLRRPTAPLRGSVTLSP